MARSRVLARVPCLSIGTWQIEPCQARIAKCTILSVADLAIDLWLPVLFSISYTRQIFDYSNNHINNSHEGQETRNRSQGENKKRLFGTFLHSLATLQAPPWDAHLSKSTVFPSRFLGAFPSCTLTRHLRNNEGTKQFLFKFWRQCTLLRRRYSLGWSPQPLWLAIL